MKQLKRLICRCAIILSALTVASCSKDAPDSLDGTTWTCTESGRGWSTENVLEFQAETFTMTSFYSESSKDDATKSELTGTYTYKAPKVTLYFEGYDGKTESRTGTCRGNKIKFDNDGSTITYTRK